MQDTRNLIDEFKGLSNEEVVDKLAKRRLPLEIAIENLEHDFNIGSIVRTANSFNVNKIHIIGKKKCAIIRKRREILFHDMDKSNYDPELNSFIP